MKTTAWSDLRLNAYHFRDWQKSAVDVVLERDDGALLGIEVKASATVSPSDFRGLNELAHESGERFAFGVLLYDGDTVVRPGDHLAAAPLSCLWSDI